jgi:hypothetical protein
LRRRRVGHDPDDASEFLAVQRMAPFQPMASVRSRRSEMAPTSVAPAAARAWPNPFAAALLEPRAQPLGEDEDFDVAG